MDKIRSNNYFLYSPRVISTISIVFLYSIYSFSYARGVSFLGYKVLLIFSFLASCALFLEKQNLVSRKVITLYLCFLGLSTASVFFPPSEYTNIDWLVASIVMLLLASVIVISFANPNHQAFSLFKWGLFSCWVVLSSLIILQQILDVPIKNIFPEFVGFEPYINVWSQKYYSFWLLFLMWGTVSFFWKKNKHGTLLSLGIILLSGITIYTEYSDSAKIAFLFSIIIFVLAHLKYSRWLFLWNLLITIYIFTLPFVWNLFSTYGSKLSAIEIFNNMAWRVEVYNFSANVILDQWFLGYGFGSSLLLMQRLPFETGGHPHNIVLLFWLELGLFGAFLLTIAVMVLLSYISKTTQNRVNGPSVWALFSCGFIIFSFSFDIWLTDVVLTYCMWLAMIMLACQHTAAAHALKEISLRPPSFHFFVLTITVIGMVSYLVRAIIF